MDRNERLLAMEEIKNRQKAYFEKENAFYDMEGALCENVSPAKCDCSKCPLHSVCIALDKEAAEIEKELKKIYGGKNVK